MWAAAISFQQNPIATSLANGRNFCYKDSYFAIKLLQNQKQNYDFRRSFTCSSSSSSSGDYLSQQNHEISNNEEYKGLWQKWKASSADMSSKVAKLGLAAVLAYGIFDGVTYTSFFVLAFLGYEKSTGKNPAANLQALLGIVILMWTGNNVTRPFRVAGAAALAPVIDKGLRKLQKYFNFPTLIYAFTLVAGIIAGSCFTIAGLLILSRWGK